MAVRVQLDVSIPPPPLPAGGEVYLCGVPLSKVAPLPATDEIPRAKETQR